MLNERIIQIQIREMGRLDHNTGFMEFSETAGALCEEEILIEISMETRQSTNQERLRKALTYVLQENGIHPYSGRHLPHWNEYEYEREIERLMLICEQNHIDIPDWVYDVLF